jgi:hypothetical protein
MIIWRLIRRPAFVGLATMVTLWLAAGAALAFPSPKPGPVMVGATCGGTGCLGQVGVVLTGPGKGAGNTSYASVNVPPPPCWYGPPAMTAAQMYQQILVGQIEKGSPGAPPPVYTGFDPALITKLYKTNAQGLWYQLQGNPADPQYSACINKDNSFQWVPAGNALMQVPVPPATLALYALSKLTLQKPRVTLNPAANKSVVNLPTFVRINPPAGAVNGQIYVTATIPNVAPNGGPESVTVAVTEKSVGISPGTSGTAYTAGCGPTGSKQTAAQMNAAGAGATPDCGVVYQQPSAAAPFTLSVTQTWMATAYVGGFVAGKQGNLLPVGQQGPLQSPANALQVLVREIQSVNG